MIDRRRRFEAQALPHLDAAYNLARWLARPPLDADDIVQEAILRAWRAFDSVRGEDVKPWLLTIVRNCFLTAAGQAKRRQNVPLPADSEIGLADPALIAADPDPEVAIVQMDARRQLNDLLAGLPPDFREVLVLREMEDLSYGEIARIIGAPIGTVMSRLARGRALLKTNWRLAAEGSRHVMQ
jgi:RNA polymerase sigma-70 factor (ECF subfamily)